MKMSGSPFFLEEDLLTAEDEIRRHLVLGQYNLLYAVKEASGDKSQRHY